MEVTLEVVVKGTPEGHYYDIWGDAHASAARSLLGELHAESELRDHVTQKSRLRDVSAYSAGTFARELSNVLVAALGTGGAVTVLIRVIGVWLKTRHPNTKINITVGDDKLAVDMENMEPDDQIVLIERVISAMQKTKNPAGQHDFAPFVDDRAVDSTVTADDEPPALDQR